MRRKRILSMLLALVMLLSFAVPVNAIDINGGSGNTGNNRDCRKKSPSLDGD